MKLFASISYLIIGSLGFQSLQISQDENSFINESILSFVNLNTQDSNNISLKNEKIGELSLGQPVALIKKIIGNPDEVTKVEIWGSDGDYHQTWRYKRKGIEIDLVGDNESKKICSIIIVAPCKLKTKEKIGVGSSLDDVQRAYKTQINSTFSNSETIVIGSIYDGLVFFMDLGKVNKIILGSMAE